MLKLVIIEHEQAAVENLLHELNGLDGHDHKVAVVLRSVEESITWFNDRAENIDVIFMDIRLTENFSFASFKSLSLYTPVIYTTVCDKYLLPGMAYNGIDYLVKPVRQEKLRQSLTKLDNLKKHFTTNYMPASFGAAGEHGSLCKSRIIVKKGIEFQSIKTEEVAFIYTEHKLVFLVDKEGKKYLAHASNLTDLMTQLNKNIFFRANRKYIININFIKKYKPFDRVKMEVELSVTHPEMVVISQENSGNFRSWIESL